MTTQTQFIATENLYSSQVGGGCYTSRSLTEAKINYLGHSGLRS